MSKSKPGATDGPAATHVEERDSVVIRFAGDSGDGMQLTGTQFTDTAAIVGNDISTMPDFPAEIRAPAGTLAGVSGYQVHLSDHDIFTPGDAPQVLVAMNPAALKTSLPDLVPGGAIIANTDEFNPPNLKKAGYESNPLQDGSLQAYRLIEVPLTSMNRRALEDVAGLTTREIDRCKNFFALGLTFWIYDRPLDNTLAWIQDKFKNRPQLAEANRRALQAGYHFGETMEAFQTRVRVGPASLPPGTYRKVTGNEALAMGLITAAHLANKPLVYCSYPITPASDILHYLAALKHFDVRTFQAEDEIAAIGTAIGASFGGAFAATGTSGPGLALKSEALNLAIVLELPLVVIDVQRGGPSTGLPTKTEQSDLLQALFGRNGESPIPIVAPATPAECFDLAILAYRMAAQAMTPVMILSDGYLANSAEPWLIPDPHQLEPIPVAHPMIPGPARPAAPSHGGNGQGGHFLPYERDDHLGRPWALPGTPGFEHRIGGLSKEPVTGNVSYEPEHHQQMVAERAEKVARLAELLPPLEVHGPPRGDLLVLGWGSTYGALRQAVNDAQAAGRQVAHAHLRHLNPFPKELATVLGSYAHVLVPELNGGQLALLIQGRFLRPVISLPKVQGRPFKIVEVRERIMEILEGERR
jgi:2-oxoglutarate ferredoxin oxidoreductase subunit alpha